MAKKKEEKEEGKQKRVIIGTKFFVFFRLSIFRPSHFFGRRNIDHLYTFGSAVQIHHFFFLCKDSSNIFSVQNKEKGTC
jgi:hypothetical protein